MVWAAPHTAEATTNRAIPDRNTLLRPSWSDSLPMIAITIVLVSR